MRGVNNWVACATGHTQADTLFLQKSTGGHTRFSCDKSQLNVHHSVHAQGVKMLPSKTLMARFYQKMIDLEISDQTQINLLCTCIATKELQWLTCFFSKDVSFNSTIFCMVQDLSPLVLVFLQKRLSVVRINFYCILSN